MTDTGGARVFVPHQPHEWQSVLQDNIQLLRSFGEVVFLAECHSRPDRNSTAVSARMDDILQDFDPERDYLAWTAGDPTTLLMAGVALGRRQITSCKFLRYERHSNSLAKFIPVDMQLGPDAVDWDRPPQRPVPCKE